MEKKYNVYICAIEGGKAAELIGENMSDTNGEKRILTGLMRIDRQNYFVGKYEVGSKVDKKLAAELKK